MNISMQNVQFVTWIGFYGNDEVWGKAVTLPLQPTGFWTRHESLSRGYNRRIYVELIYCYQRWKRL